MTKIDDLLEQFDRQIRNETAPAEFDSTVSAALALARTGVPVGRPHAESNTDPEEKKLSVRILQFALGGVAVVAALGLMIYLFPHSKTPPAVTPENSAAIVSPTPATPSSTTPAPSASATRNPVVSTVIIDTQPPATVAPVPTPDIAREYGITFGTDTPIRIWPATGTYYSTLADYLFYDFENICKTSDIVADVIVREWIGEVTKPHDVSFYKAVVVNSLKGGLPTGTEIVIAQFANSKDFDAASPLYGNGNHFVAFLSKGQMSKYYPDRTDLYYSPVTGKDSLLDVADVGGAKYLASRWNYNDTDYEKANLASIQINDAAVKQSILDRLKLTDPILSANFKDYYPQFFRYEDFISVIRNYSGAN